MKPIYFHFSDEKIRIPNSTRIKGFISFIFKKERKTYLRIDYVFCSDKYLLRLNQKFLHHDYYTDILSFQLNEYDSPIMGEIYISSEQVRYNAKKYNCSFYDELLRVIIHGALHLCGYIDKTQIEKSQMRELENKYLNAFTMFHVKHNSRQKNIKK